MRFAVLSLFAAAAAFAEGELRLQVRDATGAGVAATVQVACDAHGVRRSAITSASGSLSVRDLPFGTYRIDIAHAGFAPLVSFAEIRSGVPVHLTLTLGVAPVSSEVNVRDRTTLIDPARTGVAYSIAPQALAEQISPQPARGLFDVIASQPGWLEEDSGVLHPRGSENDVQFVVDGLPFLEKRAPAFAPGMDAPAVQSMRLRTAGYPAEYGRKLGGVVEITTPKDPVRGLHVDAAASGGSFETADGSLGLTLGTGRNRFSLTGDTSRTDRFLDPPVLANYTNSGTAGSFAASWSRDLTDRDRLRATLVRNSSRFEVPNEFVQQQNGQRQDRTDAETSGQVYYQRILTPDLLLDAQASLRDNTARLWSNPLATPMIAGQNRGYRSAYARAAISGHHGRHDWKAGVDAIYGRVREALDYTITDPRQFDPGTLPRFAFRDRARDREQAAYVQDQLRFGNLTLALGLRFDRYSVVVRQSAWSPRLGASYYFSRLGLLLNASYDRVYQTPAVENLLLASSGAVPVRGARGNFYEIGLAKTVFGVMRLDVNLFRRQFANMADDDMLLNTGISFPISFASAGIHGIEAKLELPSWRRFSGFLGYANQAGIGQGPITGGLFLSELAAGERFPLSQDQRNTANGAVRYQLSKRLWLASTASWGSGFPVEIDNPDYAVLVEEYGPAILSRVNLNRGRTRPNFSLNAAAGIDLHRTERARLTLQAQCSNLTNRVNVVNFASLFSGTTIAIPRSETLRLAASF